jgi:tetratricopeptide (TPR) repeat protein
MATVFRAMDRRLGRAVAVKVLHPELTHLLGSERFHREVSIAAALQHPNIVPVFESGHDGDLLYYTMALVEGETLRARLERDTQLPLEEALRIAEDVADALRCAHEHGIVHRDIKPENILLSGGHAVVVDFGVARAITEAGGDRLTSAGMAIGTPAYMSPEQAGGAAHLDGRVDIYALGCVLYEMLGGEPPFTGPSAQAVLARQMTESPRSLHVVRATVSPALQRVIEKALSKVPADRYATVDEFLAALERAKQSPGWRAGKAWRAALVGAGVLAAAVVAAVLWPRPPRLDPLKVVVFPLAVSNGRIAAGSGEDLAQVISSAMEQTEPLRVVFGWTWLTPAQRRDAAQLTAADARRIARARGARYYVDGSLVQLGDSARVALRLHDAGADSLLDQRSAAGLASASVLPRLALTTVARLLPRLLPTERGFDLSVLEDVNPAALSDWLLGERFFRRSRFDSAVVFYQRAVALDSGFTYASLRGAQAADWNNDTALALTLINVALRTGQRLPARYQEFSLGFRYFLIGDADSAASHLRRAVAGDTGWAGAWMELGEVYYHLLPADADGGATAQAAFERAHRLAPEFSPALSHLTEIAARSGQLDRADSLAAGLRAAGADSEEMTRLELILACARRGPQAVGWDTAAKAHALALVLAAKAEAAGFRLPACAEAGLRAVLRLNPNDSLLAGIRWGALLVLQGLLVGEGRMASARDVLNREYARGVSGVLGIYVADAGLGAGTDSGAAHAADIIARIWPRLDSVSTRALRDLGLWAWRRGDRARLDSIVAILAARLPKHDPRDSVEYGAMAARSALWRGDTVAAIARLRTVRALGPGGDLAWTLSAPSAEERLLLARLLLTQRDYRGAAKVAEVFDNQEPVAFVAFVPASLEIRAAAARGLGEGRAAAEFEARLADIARASRQEVQER